MRITLTLQSAYTGNTSIGPFTVSGTTNGGPLNGVNMTTGSISRTQLTSGWGYDDLTDTITGGTINSSGTCITGKTWTVIPPTPTPTPTSTPIPPTPTAGVFYEYQINPTSYTQPTQACENAGGEPAPVYETVYAATNSAGDVTQFFINDNLTTGYTGTGQFYAYYTSSGGAPSGFPYVGRVSNQGFVTDRSLCP